VSTLRRFLRGDLALGTSYWWFGAGATAVFASLVLLLGLLVLPIPLSRSLTPGVVAILAVAALVLARVQLTGIFRAATRHEVDGLRMIPSRASPLGHIARLAAIGGVLVSFVPVAIVGSLPLRKPHAPFVEPEWDGSGPVGDSLLFKSGTDILLAGRFTEGLADRLQRMLEDNPGVEVVHLGSSGGDAREAARIADLIEQRELVTYVRNQCLSACLLVFLSGRERWADYRARLGFHGPAPPDAGRVDAAGAPLPINPRAILDRLAPDWLSHVEPISPWDIWLPPRDAFAAAGIAFSIAAPDRFPEFEPTPSNAVE